MNTFDFNEAAVMYKDAYGCRPRGINIDSWTARDFEKEFNSLNDIIEMEEREAAAMQSLAIICFERKVTELIAVGAKTRETAIRWLHDADNTDGDDDYLCFKHGLPYRYFTVTSNHRE